MGQHSYFKLEFNIEKKNLVTWLGFNGSSNNKTWNLKFGEILKPDL
jgi:hypothetical protein